MSVAMGMQNRLTGEYRVVPISSSETWREVWLPLCLRFDLVHLRDFQGGALCSVPAELIPDIIRELGVLAEVVVTEGHEWIAERITNILSAFAETNPEEWEYDFG